MIYGYVCIHGGAINCELLFAGLPMPLLGAVSKRWMKSARGGPSDGVNVAAGIGMPLLQWRLLATSSLLKALLRTEPYKNWEDLSNGKKHGFQCEKAVKQWHGHEAIVKGQKKVIWTE
jgi:hypothetical protein